MRHLGKILILLILLAVLAILSQFTGLIDIFGSSTEIEIKMTELDKGRFVGGDKISITDQIRVKQTGEFVKEYEWQRIRNIRKEVKVEYLTESGYFVDDIISSVKVDSLRGGNIFARSLIVKVPYPDSLFFQPAGDKTINKAGLTEGWTERWIVDEEAQEAFKLFLIELKQKSYESFLDDNASPESNLSLAKATLSILRFVNNGYELGDDIGFSSIQAVFEERQGLNRPTIMVTCLKNGNCKQEILMNNEKFRG
ncbi:MAG: hypothetical protein ACI86M_000201 [Saprospiraceae bacterium]|jgi:hypothetical protein